MQFKINFKIDILNINASNFNEMALNLFKFQSKNNLIYQKYLAYLGINVNDVKYIEEIPYLPISFFKTQQVTTGKFIPQTVFKSSGTTGQTRSSHNIDDLQIYKKVSKMIFEGIYGPLSDYIIVALLPSYLENKDSSLVYMVNYFIELTRHPSSCFVTLDSADFVKKVYDNRGSKKFLLLGVTYALLDLGSRISFSIPEAIIMETGGMKGRGEELARIEVHALLKSFFQTKEIHSEYGMTELLSQAYAQSEGIFKVPFTMKVFTREINDPLSLNDQKSQGALNLIDLANIDSCAFIATEDIGTILDCGTFIVNGRIDNSDIRGCNLLSIG